MKILLDHNLDRRLKQHFESGEVYTVHDRRWDSLRNGELLSQAEASGFDVLITADTNIKYQQNLALRKIAILIIRAPDNRLATHVQMILNIRQVLSELKPGTIAEVRHSSM